VQINGIGIALRIISPEHAPQRKPPDTTILDTFGF